MKKIFVAIMAAIAMIFVAPAPVASAGNGTSNFYLATKCYPSGGYNGARGSATNWDIPTGQQYHLDLNADSTYTTSSGGIVIASLISYQIKIDGVTLGGTEGIYKRFNNRTRHWITFVWKKKIGGGLVACSFWQ